jgi:RimJ/RimL family protein N-acetyltransferase
VLTIRDAATDEYAGEIGVMYTEPQVQQAMIAYSLAPRWRGRGYASRAVRLVTAWAFDQVGIVRLTAGTAPDNIASQRVLEAAGFTREAYQRALLPGPDGTRIDNIMYVRYIARQMTP